MVILTDVFTGEAPSVLGVGVAKPQRTQLNYRPKSPFCWQMAARMFENFARNLLWNVDRKDPGSPV
jgi:hypothetical protein